MQRSALATVVLTFGLLTSSLAPAWAGPATIAGAFKAASMAPMNPKKATLAPMAYVIFCSKNPGECARTGGSADVVSLDDGMVALLDQVNRDVNKSIRPKADRPKGPMKDIWSLAPREGDCEDFAITKRHRLMAQGIPSSALLLAVARTSDGEGHAVLVVRTSDGDVVLDNRTSRIRPWREAGLSWVKMQSPEDPRRWVSL
ncbi:transglutaminase-like cysteine peptidase [Chthonobacter albigriseus]|uniref:transglutaminase-like cysteine peptidase n=1 Tax=Chthonobacter albigriseus TaxID=1683161 RepID=UPI0015EF7CED|nr:transglutaminase-like cysteine peptidase [Chthonobacter albigriseus]